MRPSSPPLLLVSLPAPFLILTPFVPPPPKLSRPFPHTHVVLAHPCLAPHPLPCFTPIFRALSRLCYSASASLSFLPLPQSSSAMSGLDRGFFLSRHPSLSRCSSPCGSASVMINQGDELLTATNEEILAIAAAADELAKTIASQADCLTKRKQKREKEKIIGDSFPLPCRCASPLLISHAPFPGPSLLLAHN